MTDWVEFEGVQITVPDVPPRACSSRRKCRGHLVPDLDTVSVDEGDGFAMLDTACSEGCGMYSCHAWRLSDGEYEAVFGHAFDDVRCYDEERG